MDIARAVRARAERRMTSALQHVGDVWAQATKAEASREPIGRLVDDVSFEVTGQRTGKLVIQVKGKFVLTGSRPHLIRPRTAKALHFQVGGRGVFATTVHHPGTPPHPFPQRAWTSASVQMAKHRFAQVLFEPE